MGTMIVRARPDRKRTNRTSPTPDVFKDVFPTLQEGNPLSPLALGRRADIFIDAEENDHAACHQEHGGKQEGNAVAENIGQYSAQ